MRSILLHIADDDCLEARLQVALDLARCFEGHISCLQATPYQVGVPGDIYGTMTVQLLPELRKAADALRERIEARLGGEGVTWSWDQQDGPAAERLVAKSGLSDLIVVGNCDAVSGQSSDLPGAVVVRARSPILLVPAAVAGLDPSRPAVVAWDGSPEACRALRAALPLLARAQEVILASVEEQRKDRRLEWPATDGAEYLSRHGIACEMVALPAEDRSIAQVLAGAAAARDAAYLVMGAYGHARFTEIIWGGVTRELFAHTPLPLFACH